MTLIEYLTKWVDSQRDRLSSRGVVQFRVSPDDGRDKSSALVAVEREGHFVELSVWSSGESEFGYGRPGQQRDEHHELESIEDLELLLSEFLSRLP